MFQNDTLVSIYLKVKRSAQPLSITQQGSTCGKVKVFKSVLLRTYKIALLEWPCKRARRQSTRCTSTALRNVSNLIYLTVQNFRKGLHNIFVDNSTQGAALYQNLSCPIFSVPVQFFQTFRTFFNTLTPSSNLVYHQRNMYKI